MSQPTVPGPVLSSDTVVAPARSSETRLVRSTRSAVRFIRKKPLGAAGAGILIIVLLVAVLAPLVATHDPNATDAYAPLASPGGDHLLGTDRLGRDLFSRLVYGARVSVSVGIGAVIVGMVLATVIGLSSGYYSGIVDLTVQRIIDVASAFPFLVALISFVRIVPAPDSALSLGLWEISPQMQTTAYIVVVLGILLSINASRVIRGVVLTVREEQYVSAARATGAGDLRIMATHILPNVFPTMIVLATNYLGAAIFIEAAISFLGVGLPPSVPSWGRMLNEATESMRQSINASIWPGLAIAIVVWSANLLGDALRDVLDPRLRTIS